MVYFIASTCYLILLLLYLSLSYRHGMYSLFVGKIVQSLYLCIWGNCSMPEKWFDSLSSELWFLIISPGTIIGMFVGYMRVTAWHQLIRTLIPPGILSILFLVCFFLPPNGSLATVIMLPMLLVTAFPYSLIGGMAGWGLRAARNGWQR